MPQVHIGVPHHNQARYMPSVTGLGGIGAAAIAGLP
jgi:hypothetical protein